jgi:hypothetical protein
MLVLRVLMSFTIFITALSGCASPDEIATPAKFDQKFSFEGCQAGGSTSYYGTTNQSEIQGWREFDGLILPHVDFGTCQKISLPSLTVDEVNFVILLTDSQNAPDTCKGPSGTNPYVLQWMLFDNQLVVEYLSFMNAPVSFSEIQVEIDQNGAPSIIGGWGPNSQFGLQNSLPERTTPQYSEPRLIAWQNGTGVNLIDFQIEGSLAATFQNLSMGTVDSSKPGSPDNGQWLGTTEIFPEVSFSGTSAEYVDLECLDTEGVSEERE